MTELARDLRSPSGVPVQRELAFSAVLSGMLNDEAVDLVGSGILNEENGITEGRYEIRRLPCDLDPRSLGAFLMTGYPNSCATRNANVGNPFSGGNYKYRRNYAFGSGERACLDMRCEPTDDSKLASYFHVTGRVPSLGDARGVASIHELWAPRQQHIDGAFEVAWFGNRQDSIIATATATSNYKPVEIELLRGQQRYRFLELDSRIDTSGDLVITQRSELVELTKGPDARRMLN